MQVDQVRSPAWWRRAVSELLAVARADLRRPRYLGASEEILVETRQHPFAIVGAFVGTLGWLIPVAMVTWGLGGITFIPFGVVGFIQKALALVMVVFLLRFVAQVLGWEFERVLITNQKVIHIHGLLARRMASTPLTKVSELTVDQPLLGRIFGYGSLVVDVPGGREQALHGLAWLPDPAGLYRLIADQARVEQRSMGRQSHAPEPWLPASSGGADVTTVIKRLDLTRPGPSPRPGADQSPGV